MGREEERVKDDSQVFTPRSWKEASRSPSKAESLYCGSHPKEPIHATVSEVPHLLPKKPLPEGRRDRQGRVGWPGGLRQAGSNPRGKQGVKSPLCPRLLIHNYCGFPLHSGKAELATVLCCDPTSPVGQHSGNQLAERCQKQARTAE